MIVSSCFVLTMSKRSTGRSLVQSGIYWVKRSEKKLSLISLEIDEFVKQILLKRIIES